MGHRYIVFAAVLLSTLISCNGDQPKSDQENYENTRQKLLQTELKNPPNFIKAINTDRKNLLGQTVIKGKITNTATLAVYKDINLKLSFYSKTKALLEADTETIFEQIGPGQTKEFKTKYFAPKGTDSVSIQVISATPGD